MTTTIGPDSTMADVLEVFPGAQRALFRKYHIGGCASCGFQPTETLAQVCARNDNLSVDEVLDYIKTSHEQDAKILITPKDLAALLQQDKGVKLVDVRSREEFEAARIEGSVLLSQPLMQEIMGSWPKNQLFVVVDHQGKRALDGAAYFLGHGFESVRALHGGIDAWSQEVDENVPRYRLS
ncbi:MAG: rhodanese-like domain-containing protein [Verrucomicrobiota bacterium]